MKQIEIIYAIFYKEDQIYDIGDYFMTKYHNQPIEINTISSLYINNSYTKINCSKIPFTFNINIMLTDDIINIIKKQYNSCTEVIKNKYKNEFEFIMTSKYINNSMYRFYNKIKSIEFIPKTQVHLKTLYDAVNL